MDDEKEMQFSVTGLFFGNDTKTEAINSVIELFNNKKYVSIK